MRIAPTLSFRPIVTVFLLFRLYFRAGGEWSATVSFAAGLAVGGDGASAILTGRRPEAVASTASTSTAREHSVHLSTPRDGARVDVRTEGRSYLVGDEQRRSTAVGHHSDSLEHPHLPIAHNRSCREWRRCVSSVPRRHSAALLSDRLEPTDRRELEIGGERRDGVPLLPCNAGNCSARTRRAAARSSQVVGDRRIPSQSPTARTVVDCRIVLSLLTTSSTSTLPLACLC